MSKPFLNEVFLARLDELIIEGEKQWEAQRTHEKHKIMDIVGLDLIGVVPFLVRQVRADEPVYYVPRDIP